MNKLQKQAVKDWNGGSVLSLYPNGMVKYQDFSVDQQEKHDAENFHCAMMILDDMKVPTHDPSNGEVYSIVGRIKWLNNKQSNK